MQATKTGQVVSINSSLSLFYSLQKRAFRSLCFTMDGEYVIAGGKSKYICIYNVKEESLVKRFEISQNKSFDGIDVRRVLSFFWRLLS